MLLDVAVKVRGYRATTCCVMPYTSQLLPQPLDLLRRVDSFCQGVTQGLQTS